MPGKTARHRPIKTELAEKQDRLLNDALGLRARAIVLQGAIDTPWLRDLAANDHRLIFVNRRPPEGVRGPFVGVDNFAAGVTVGQHFAERGYRHCVVMHGPLFSSGARERLDGFLAGYDRPSEVETMEAEFNMEAGYDRGLQLLKGSGVRRSIFCGNDMIAYGVYRAAHELGLSVPDDVRILGFDDNRINDWIAPWLSTVSVPTADYGPAVSALIMA